MSRGPNPARSRAATQIIKPITTRRLQSAVDLTAVGCSRLQLSLGVGNGSPLWAGASSWRWWRHVAVNSSNLAHASISLRYYLTMHWLWHLLETASKRIGSCEYVHQNCTEFELYLIALTIISSGLTKSVVGNEEATSPFEFHACAVAGRSVSARFRAT